MIRRQTLVCKSNFPLGLIETPDWGREQIPAVREDTKDSLSSDKGLFVFPLSTEKWY